MHISELCFTACMTDVVNFSFFFAEKEAKVEHNVKNWVIRKSSTKRLKHIGNLFNILKTWYVV